MAMKFVLNRIAQTLVTLWLIVTLVVLALALVPGDPAVLIAGPYASEEQIQLVREEFDLNLPLHIRYVKYIGDLLQGNLGK